MNTDKLIGLITSHFGKELSNDRSLLKSERERQYRNIYGNDWDEQISKVVETPSPAALHNHLATNRLKRVFDANPQLECLASKIQVQAIEANVEATKTIKLPNERYAILLDTHTMLFLWMMNKAYVYGQSQLSGPDNAVLYSEIFLYFSTLRYKDVLGGILKRPQTPPHRNDAEFTCLTIFTELQETFLLCHELAHIYIEIGGEVPSRLISKKDHDLQYSKFFPTNPQIDEELLADELAFEWMLQALDKSIPEVVEVVCVAVFLLIRYFMWLRLTHHDLCDSAEHHLWFARNTFFREKFREVYFWTEPTFIVDLFEHLEGVLEPASMYSAEIFREIIKECGIDQRTTIGS